MLHILYYIYYIRAAGGHAGTTSWGSSVKLPHARPGKEAVQENFDQEADPGRAPKRPPKHKDPSMV